MYNNIRHPIQTFKFQNYLESLGYNLHIICITICITIFIILPDPFNRVNFKSPISRVPKLFGIHFLLGLIGNTLAYNLYIVVYLQQVPFSYKSIILLRHSDTFFFIEVFQFSKELPKYRSNSSAQQYVEHNFKGIE